jgi:uncharacterized protein YcbK (DUF882 family)
MTKDLKNNASMNRRAFLLLIAHCSAGAVLANPLSSLATSSPGTYLSFYHTHTGETLKVNLKETSSQTLRRVHRFLRDFRTGEVHPIDPQLLTMLSRIKKLSGSSGTFEVISGYRSPKTNKMLSTASNGVAKKSLHMDGRAIDVRLTELRTRDLRDLACSLKQGGVGYYPKSDFVHIDTGRVRTW